MKAWETLGSPLPKGTLTHPLPKGQGARHLHAHVLDHVEVPDWMGKCVRV